MCRLCVIAGHEHGQQGQAMTDAMFPAEHFSLRPRPFLLANVKVRSNGPVTRPMPHDTMSRMRVWCIAPGSTEGGGGQNPGVTRPLDRTFPHAQKKSPIQKKIKWPPPSNRAETLVWRGFKADLNIVLDVKGC